MEFLLKGCWARAKERWSFRPEAQLKKTVNLGQRSFELSGNVFPPSLNGLGIGGEGQVSVFTPGLGFATEAQRKSRDASPLGVLWGNSSKPHAWKQAQEPNSSSSVSLFIPKKFKGKKWPQKQCCISYYYLRDYIPFSFSFQFTIMKNNIFNFKYLFVLILVLCISFSFWELQNHWMTSHCNQRFPQWPGG